MINLANIFWELAPCQTLSHSVFTVKVNAVIIPILEIELKLREVICPCHRDGK